MIKPQHQIAAMSAYAVAELTAPLGQSVFSLSQNESLRAPSPRTLSASRKALESTALYPDPEWTNLRTALGDLHGFDPKMVLCGNGSLELIAAIARVYGGPGRAVLAPSHAYPFFRTATLMSGARFDTALEDELTASVDYLLDAVRPDTSVVFIANPGNPTGTRLPLSELRRLRASLRPDILLVIDEAYGEFSDVSGERCWPMVEEGNCIVLRTFSKAYGLAGLRVGWGLFPRDIATEVRKVLSPNSVTSVSQAAAQAALTDQVYMQETCQITEDCKNKWRAILKDSGFDVPPSYTNFMMIRLTDDQDAHRADQALREQGVFLRGQRGAGLPELLRMTIGPDEIMERAVSCLIKWKKK